MIEAASPHTMNTYGRVPIALERGQGGDVGPGDQVLVVSRLVGRGPLGPLAHDLAEHTTHVAVLMAVVEALPRLVGGVAHDAQPVEVLDGARQRAELGQRREVDEQLVPEEPADGCVRARFERLVEPGRQEREGADELAADLAEAERVSGTEVVGATPLWEWMGDDTTVFSY